MGRGLFVVATVALSQVAGRLVALDHIDADIVQEQQEVVELIGVELDVLQHVVDVVDVQVALLATFNHQGVDFFDALDAQPVLGRFAGFALLGFVAHVLRIGPHRPGHDGEGAEGLAPLPRLVPRAATGRPIAFVTAPSADCASSPARSPMTLTSCVSLGTTTLLF